MGQIVINPGRLDLEDLSNAKLLVFPFRLSGEQRKLLKEWARLSQTPIFLHKSDIAKMVEDGLDRYRFHPLQGLREVDFQGGSLEFLPAKRLRGNNLVARIQGLGEYLDVLPVYAFHVLIRPLGEKSCLYLASPQIEERDIRIFRKERISFLIASGEYFRESWLFLQKRFAQDFVFESETEMVSTMRHPANLGKEPQFGVDSR